MNSPKAPIPDDYLATGFANVDKRNNASPFTTCLQLLDSLPYFQTYKQRSYELLDLTPGLSILEVGCGLGDDLRRMAEPIGSLGRLIGIDASHTLLSQAKTRLANLSCVNLFQADARHLPFPDEHFDRCRIDRTLQHIKHPERVIREMARVLKPGGLMLAYDNDWGTFSVSGQDEEASRLIEDIWTRSLTNRNVGRHLPRYFFDAGLRLIGAEPSVSVLTDFDLADRVYNLKMTARLAVEQGFLSVERKKHWLKDLQQQSQMGVFLCSLTTYTVVGQKSNG